MTWLDVPPMHYPTALSSECAVLFVDLTNSTPLYEKLGDSAAFALVKLCLEAMEAAVGEASGRVVKTTGDGVMATFWDADHAADAAISIQQALRAVDSHGESVGVRIGFHYGPVVESEADVFGDTVNVAARLCEMGSAGVAMITQDTANRLHSSWRHMLRPGPHLTLKGISRPIEIVQLLCDAQAELTSLGEMSSTIEEDSVNRELRLYHNGEKTIFDHDSRRLCLGRDPEADLRINDPMASRRHGEIERRGDKFVFVDRSSNGTFISIEGEREFVLWREEAVLHGHGWLSFGAPRSKAQDTVEFFCL